MLRNMDGRYPHMPGDMVDRNNNGAIDPDEIDIPTNSGPGHLRHGSGLLRDDRSQQGRPVPPGELQADIVLPTSSTRSGCGSSSAASWI